MRAIRNITLAGGCAIAAVVVLAIADGTVRANGFYDSFFDVFVAETAGPPYPSEPPIQVMVENRTTSSAARIETEIVALSLTSSTSANMPLRMRATDSGGPEGTAGPDSFFDVFVEVDPAEFPAESFFDVFVEIDLPGVTAHPSLVSTPAVFPAESFFDVFVEIDLPGLAPNVLATRYSPGPGIILADVRVGNVNLTESFFDVFVDLRTTDGYTLDPDVRVVNVRMVGQYLPEPTTLLLLAVGGGMLLVRRRRQR